MTVQEFSNQFDVLYNNITSNQAPGLNEYEKSVFLTKALDEIVKNYFNPSSNPKLEGFDDSPKRLADFANLIETKTLSSVSTAVKLDPRSTCFLYPDDAFLILNEQIFDGSTPYVIKALSYEEYDRLMSKPYKYPCKYQAWRLITKTTATSDTISVFEPGEVTSRAITTNLGSGNPYRNLSITAHTNSLIPVNITIYNVPDTLDTTYETLYDHYAPEIDTLNSSQVDITINIPENVALNSNESGLNYYTGCIVNNSLLAQYVTFDWPNEVADWYNARPEFGENGAIWTITVQAHNVSRTVASKTPIIELVGRFNNNSPTYSMRYVRRPKPIILANLAESGVYNTLSILGQSIAQTSELSEELHEEILQRAVELAKVAWVSTGNENTQLVIEAGKRSE